MADALFISYLCHFSLYVSPLPSLRPSYYPNIFSPCCVLFNTPHSEHTYLQSNISFYNAQALAWPHTADVLQPTPLLMSYYLLVWEQRNREELVVRTNRLDHQTTNVACITFHHQHFHTVFSDCIFPLAICHNTSPVPNTALPPIVPFFPLTYCLCVWVPL